MSDVSGRLACATKSTYFTTCPTYTDNADANIALYFPGSNSEAEAYFGSGPNQGNAAIPFVQISFSTPFVYAPVSDKFPSNVASENFGYVPQTLIEWMAQDYDYVAKFPGIASCLPGGPSVAYFCPLQERPNVFNPYFQVLHPQPLLEPGSTVSLTITVTGVGCFHPGECPTAAAPGSTAVAATAAVTSGADELQNAKTSDAVPAGNRTYSPCISNTGRIATKMAPSISVS